MQVLVELQILIDLALLLQVAHIELFEHFLLGLLLRLLLHLHLNVFGECQAVLAQRAEVGLLIRVLLCAI